MKPADIEAAHMVASLALADDPADVLNRTDEENERFFSRFRHFLEHDPGGCFVAVDDEGKVCGVSVALMREGLWVLALFAVSEGTRGSGVGKELMNRALAYGGDFSEGMIASSTHPAAMRTYANAGFVLHPTFTAKGKVRRENLPSNLNVREGDEADLELAARVDRHLRGAAHGLDLENILSGGAKMLVSENGCGGYALYQGDDLRLLGAMTDSVASDLMWAYLATCDPESDLEVWGITACQSWAVRVVLAAGLDLHPDGPICVKGNPGPLTPYLPSGLFM